MLDHIAKPPIKSQAFDEWASFISELSKHPHVFCKLSGLATEADWKHWQLDHFNVYIEHVIRCFGIDRMLFGSDWPVCLLAGSYTDSLSIVEGHLKNFTEEERKGFWGLNAVAFYGLK